MSSGAFQAEDREAKFFYVSEVLRDLGLFLVAANKDKWRKQGAGESLAC